MCTQSPICWTPVTHGSEICVQGMIFLRTCEICRTSIFTSHICTNKSGKHSQTCVYVTCKHIQKHVDVHTCIHTPHGEIIRRRALSAWLPSFSWKKKRTCKNTFICTVNTCIQIYMHPYIQRGNSVASLLSVITVIWSLGAGRLRLHSTHSRERYVHVHDIYIYIYTYG